MFVGQGELEEEIRRLVKTKGLTDSVLFLGLRTDVPDLMQAMDAFVLPSRFEGLGIVYIEAQAAGLKTFATAEVVPLEACVDESLFTYLPREATAQQWADAMLAADTTQRENKLEVIQSHGYDIHQEAEKLRALYLKGKAEGENEVLQKSEFYFVLFLILIKPGCISGIPALGILDTLLNMIRIMLVLFTLIVLFKNAQLLPVNRLFGVTMLVVASILWEPISTLTGGGSIAHFGALMNDLGIALVCYIGLRAGYDSFIEGVAKVSGAYVLINCLTVILFPAGMYATTKYSQNFFLSYRTAWFVIYLLALTTTLLWNANVGSRFTKRFAIAVAVAATLSMILQWTATGLFCFSIGGLVLLYCTWKKGIRSRFRR